MTLTSPPFLLSVSQTSRLKGKAGCVLPASAGSRAMVTLPPRVGAACVHEPRLVRSMTSQNVIRLY